jgi:hypothetical protein
MWTPGQSAGCTGDLLDWTVEWVGAAAGDVTTTEARLVATVAVLLGAALTAALVVPVLARLVGRTGDRGLRRIDREDVRSAIEDVPWVLALVGVVHGLQALVLGLTGVGLLAVWGRIDLTIAALGVLELSTPGVGRAVATVALVADAHVGPKLLEDRIQRLSERSERMDQHEEELLLRASQVLLFSLVTLVALSVGE